MIETDDAVERALDRLQNRAERLLAEHVDEGDFWSGFAGDADCLLENAGVADSDRVHARLDQILNALGLPVPGLVVEPLSAMECC